MNPKITWMHLYEKPEIKYLSKDKWLKGISQIADMLRYDEVFVSESFPGLFIKATFTGQVIHGLTESRWESFGIKPPTLVIKYSKEEVEALFEQASDLWFTYENTRNGLMPMYLSEYTYGGKQ